MRTFHVYVSMGSMLIVAFFAFTGLTLNHPDWSLGRTSCVLVAESVPAPLLVQFAFHAREKSNRA